MKIEKTDKKKAIIEAAIETLQSEGFAGASSRAIARRGGFNSALIFYHFGSVNGVLLAALDHSSVKRIERYKEAVEDIESIAELVKVASKLYREDVEAGHITVFSELIGASLSNPELQPEILARAAPWIEFVESILAKFLRGSPLESVAPVPLIARAIISFYVGENLLTHLDKDERNFEQVLDLVSNLTPIIEPMLEGSA